MTDPFTDSTIVLSICTCIFRGCKVASISVHHHSQSARRAIEHYACRRKHRWRTASTFSLVTENLSSPPITERGEYETRGRDGTRWDGEAGWDESSIAAASSTDSGQGQAVHAGGGRGMPDGGGGIPIPATPLSTDAHHRRRMNDVADSDRTAAGDAAVLSRKQIVARRHKNNSV